MLGEATLCFVRGKTEDAIRICSEVIHLVNTENEMPIDNFTK